MLNQSSVSYLSPKLEGRACDEKGGYGVFAREGVSRGELLTMWSGTIVTAEQMLALPREVSTHGIQVEEDLFQVPLCADDPADMFNHSCSPNAGLYGQIALVAMRDIAKDEEVCFDYAMSDCNDYDEFDCGCGMAECRGRIRGSDWALPELQQRYQGYFSLYLQRRIERMARGN